MEDQSKRRRGRILLLLFFGALTGATLLSLAYGLRQRSHLQSLAGPLMVEVRNETSERIVADIFMGSTPAGLEMNPGEGGIVRFNPKETTPVLIRLYGGNRGGPLLRTIEEGNFAPGQEEHVRFLVVSAGEVRIEYP